MGDQSLIEWTDATWNVINGCTVISEGCTNCYAMQLAGTRLKNDRTRKGLTRISGGRPVWTGEVRLNESAMCDPLKWTRPRMIFVCAHGDLFHESVPDEWIDQVFAVMALSPQHTFQVLTKRPERMRQYLISKDRDEAIGFAGWRIVEERGRLTSHQSLTLAGLVHGGGPHKLPQNQSLPDHIHAWPLPNVWLGTSVENQKTADERIPSLLATPAAVRWISAEPLLGPVDLANLDIDGDHLMDAIRPLSWRELWRSHYSPEATGVSLEEAIEAFTENGNPYPPTDARPNRIDWVVVGGESGSRARPMHPDWARSLRDQCAAANVPFFFKQWGHFEVIYDRDREDPDWRRGDAIARAHPKGRWVNLAGGHGFHGERVIYADPVGKKLAGRLIDGIEHNAMPVTEGGR